MLPTFENRYATDAIRALEGCEAGQNASWRYGWMNSVPPVSKNVIYGSIRPFDVIGVTFSSLNVCM